MAEAPIVSVRGEVVREVQPEIARFGVTVAAVHAEREEAIARLTQRSEAARALIDSYGDAIERRETGSLQVRPEHRRSTERVSAYHASVTTTATVVDFTVLGELMVRLATEVDQATVAGPWWELRPDSPVYAEARRAALKDAITRAEQFAEAVGARAVRLLEIADDGSGGPQPFRAMAYAMESGQAELELDPQLQTVHAAVRVRYEISDTSGMTDPRG